MYALIHFGSLGGEDLWALLLVALFLAVWLATLVRLLRWTDLDGTTKICRVVVLCALTVLGLVLYVIWGPKKYEELPRVRRLFEPTNDKAATDDRQTPG